MLNVDVDRFEVWRLAARKMLVDQVAPREVRWREPKETRLFLGVARAEQRTSAQEAEESSEEPLLAGAQFRVPKPFLELAELVAYHRQPRKWELLYRVLWRLTHGERNLLDEQRDPDVAQLRRMAEAVRRDARSMRGRVAFRRCTAGSEEYFVAWYRPEHKTLRLVAPFFVRRFQIGKWALLTPDETAFWDGHVLRFGPGQKVTGAPEAEELERLWQAWYARIFNPAQVHLPLVERRSGGGKSAEPERDAEPMLRVDQPRRVRAVAEMAEREASGAQDFLPSRRDLRSLRRAAAQCQGCELHCQATQTVFGAGAADARVMFVGEQPGDQEDAAGRPFVGPTGQLLDDVLAQVGIDREQLYVTNAVKHFKWAPRGARRLHVRPSAREIAACRPWLEAEIEAVRPQMIVCLGATAAQALLGAEFRITKQHGQVMPTRWCEWTMATYHPAALLRVPDETVRAQMQEQFLYDMRRVADAMAELGLLAVEGR